MVRLHIYDVQLSIFRAITQWSVHLRRTLYNVFRTPPSLRLFTLATNHKMLATERNQILLTMILQHKSLTGPKNCINSKNALIEVIFNGFATPTTPSHSTRKGALCVTHTL